MPFIGFILIGIGLFTMIGVLYMVTNEHQEKEEWYQPPANSTPAAPTPMTTAEVVGTQAISPSPVIDAEVKRTVGENGE